MHAQPRFRFSTPAASDTTVLQHTEKYFLKGASILATDEKPEGVSIGLEVPFKKRNGLDGFTVFTVASKYGTQHDDRHFFEFREVIKEETRESITYYLEAVFQCKLYHNPKGAGFYGELFGELTEGELVMAIEIPR